jgi:hypothetical protein
MNTKGLDEHVANYWYEHYMTEHCTLCGNSGVIDTTGVRTAVGIPVGRKNWCICPNGQILRAHVGTVCP